MRFGIDLTKFDAAYAGGVSTFALGLTGGLIGAIGREDGIVLLATRSNRDDLASRFLDARVTFVEIEDSRFHRYATAILGYLGSAIGNFKLPYWYDRVFRAGVAHKIERAVDVLFVPMTSLSLPTGNVPSVLSVHDIQHEYYPEYFSSRERAARWGRYRLSCWAASAVQASSQFVKDCLLEKFRFMTPEKIFVAPEGVDLDGFRLDAPMHAPLTESLIVPDSFLFYPAQLWPHKNHPLLIEALAKFRIKNGYEIPCVLTGQDYGMLPLVMTALERTGLSKVTYLGKVPFAVLLWLYSNCKAVLALGLHESSSLPLREGAVFGKPLICANIPPNIELERDLFLIPFMSQSAADLSKKFEILMSEAAAIREKSMQNVESVRRFSWATIATQYLVVARDLVKSK